MKKIIIVDDSALMRSIFSDIINSTKEFHVEDTASDGLEGLKLIEENSYDIVILDVNMPRMNGIEMLKEMQRRHIRIRVLMASTDTCEGAKVTMDALDLGAIDFIQKPNRVSACRDEKFSSLFLGILTTVSKSTIPVKSFNSNHNLESIRTERKIEKIISVHSNIAEGSRIVAIASSTGGPRALKEVIPLLPAKLNAPVLIVQHMPEGFTASLADRLDNLSAVKVKEAAEGDKLECGTVYIAKGGLHMFAVPKAGKVVIHYEDGPSREGVKPCANNMFESIAACGYDEIICVVLTGMGADGTEGIRNIKEKMHTFVISQEASTCTVYGMPKSCETAGLSNAVIPLENIAQEILMHTGLTK